MFNATARRSEGLRPGGITLPGGGKAARTGLRLGDVLFRRRHDH